MNTQSKTMPSIMEGSARGEDFMNLPEKENALVLQAGNGIELTSCVPCRREYKNFIGTWAKEGAKGVKMQ